MASNGTDTIIHFIKINDGVTTQSTLTAGKALHDSWSRLIANHLKNTMGIDNEKLAEISLKFDGRHTLLSFRTESAFFTLEKGHDSYVLQGSSTEDEVLKTINGSHRTVDPRHITNVKVGIRLSDIVYLTAMESFTSNPSSTMETKIQFVMNIDEVLTQSTLTSVMAAHNIPQDLIRHHIKQTMDLDDILITKIALDSDNLCAYPDNNIANKFFSLGEDGNSYSLRHHCTSPHYAIVSDFAVEMMLSDIVRFIAMLKTLRERSTLPKHIARSWFHFAPKSLQHSLGPRLYLNLVLGQETETSLLDNTTENIYRSIVRNTNRFLSLTNSYCRMLSTTEQ